MGGEINLKVNLSYGDNYMMDDNSNEEVRDGLYLQFIFWGIIIPFIACFGFIGNILTIIVLWRREMRSTTIYYLRVMVITDSGILVLAVVVLTPYSISQVSDNSSLQYYKDIVYPTIFTAFNYILMSVQTCNVWVTVSVGIERYIAICHPFRSQAFVTKKISLIVITSITVFAIVYNLPRIFATAAKKCGEESDHCLVVYSTDFGRTDFYKYVYFAWLYVFVMFVVPLATLFVLNLLLILELARMQRRRRGMPVQNDDEANMTLVLVLIVVVFIICQTPGLIAQFDIFSFPVFLKLLAVSNTLFVFNSSVNFLVYTAVGRRFRKVLLKKLFYRCLKNEAPQHTLSTRINDGYELTRLKNGKQTKQQSRNTEYTSLNP